MSTSKGMTARLAVVWLIATGCQSGSVETAAAGHGEVARPVVPAPSAASGGARFRTHQEYEQHRGAVQIEDLPAAAPEGPTVTESAKPAKRSAPSSLNGVNALPAGPPDMASPSMAAAPAHAQRPGDLPERCTEPGNKRVAPKKRSAVPGKKRSAVPGRKRVAPKMPVARRWLAPGRRTRRGATTRVYPSCLITTRGVASRASACSGARVCRTWCSTTMA